jgi:hypothetical protein
VDQVVEEEMGAAENNPPNGATKQRFQAIHSSTATFVGQVPRYEENIPRKQRSPTCGPDEDIKKSSKLVFKRLFVDTYEVVAGLPEKWQGNYQRPRVVQLGGRADASL